MKNPQQVEPQVDSQRVCSAHLARSQRGGRRGGLQLGDRGWRICAALPTVNLKLDQCYGIYRSEY